MDLRVVNHLVITKAYMVGYFRDDQTKYAKAPKLETDNTPDETVEKIKEISVSIGKTPVQVKEAAGFVVNRILIPMINEASQRTPMKTI